MAGRSLRGVSLAITLLSLIIFSTLAYSAYEDTQGILKISANASATPAIVAVTSYNGTTATVKMNITLNNEGLYPLQFSVACVQTPGGFNATCSLPQATIQPGQSMTVSFTMTVDGVSQQSGVEGRPVEADFDVALQPFASLQISANLGGLVAGTGGG